MKNNDNGINGIAAGLLVFGIIIIIGMIGNAADSSSNRCIKAGCDNKRASGSSYCYIHKPYTGGGATARNSSSTTSTYSDGTSGRTYSPGIRSTTESTPHYSTGTSSGSRTYNTLNNDPEDYDDPEEYADDAWGDDFDNWDEAYDYWEDY